MYNLYLVSNLALGSYGYNKSINFTYTKLYAFSLAAIGLQTYSRLIFTRATLRQCYCPMSVRLSVCHKPVFYLDG